MSVLILDSIDKRIRRGKYVANMDKISVSIGTKQLGGDKKVSLHDLNILLIYFFASVIFNESVKFFKVILVYGGFYCLL